MPVSWNALPVLPEEVDQEGNFRRETASSGSDAELIIEMRQTAYRILNATNQLASDRGQALRSIRGEYEQLLKLCDIAATH
jgi:hypothetical protein